MQQVCNICAVSGHQTDFCPTLQETVEQVNVVGGFQKGQQQRNYNPYSNTYNPGWRDHPNFSYGNRNTNFQQPPRPQFQLSYQQQPSTSAQTSNNSGISIHSMLQNLTDVVLRNEQKNEVVVKTLESQITQLAGSINKLEANQGRLPSQAEKNPSKM
jgi:hypothetical protein